MLVPIRIGRDEHGEDVYIDLRDSWHVGIQGMSRSGKSCLAYAILTLAAMMLEVVVCGCDPTGILFAPWAAAPGQLLRASGTRETLAVRAAVSAIVDEMERRIAMLPELDLDKFSEFTPTLPILLVILEEYPGLLSALEADDEAEGRKPVERIAPKIKRDVRRLVQEGAKVGIRLVILAQRAEASIVGGAERSNIGLKVTLRVDNGDAVRMFHPSASPELIEMMGSAKPGQGVVDLPGEGLRRMKVDYIDYSTYLARVRAAYPPEGGVCDD